MKQNIIIALLLVIIAGIGGRQYWTEQRFVYEQENLMRAAKAIIRECQP